MNYKDEDEEHIKLCSRARSQTDEHRSVAALTHLFAKTPKRCISSAK